MKKSPLRAFLLSIICVLASQHVYSADMCSAIFGTSQKDALNKTLYFNGVSETDLRVHRKNKLELNQLRTLFRNAHDLELELNNSSRFSPKRYWLESRLKNQRAYALERSMLAKSVFEKAIDDLRNEKFFVSKFDRNIRISVRLKPGYAIEIATDTPRMADKRAERIYVESELVRTLKEIERTEQYFYAQPPTKAQAANFEMLVDSLAQSDRVVLLRRGKALPITSKNLLLGKSYLVIIANGHLVLGDGYKNLEGGTSNTHSQLRDDVRVAEFKGQAGSLRFNIDGSIDISGYHAKTVSEESAQKLLDIVRLSSPPGTVLRTTPGRLSDL
jgi:hypothetical protein